MNCTHTLGRGVTFQRDDDKENEREHNVNLYSECVDYHPIKIMIILRYMSDFLSCTFHIFLCDGIELKDPH